METNEHLVTLPQDQLCKYCSSNTGKIEVSGPHKKLLCGTCGKYLKFINQADYAFLLQYEEMQPKILDVDYHQRLDEINFKLDLIIDHFNIKEEGNENRQS